jgi:hypothetical protein
MFAQALAIAPHLSSGGLFNMIFEHFLGCFLKAMALVLGANKLLAMAKDIGGLCPIAIGEVFLQLISRSTILQLWGPFQKHLSPHQFGISTLGGCEAIPFNIRTFFDLHPDWVVMPVDVENDFNNVSQAIILESCMMPGGFWQALSPLPSCFMVFIFLFTTIMGNMWRGSPLLNHI